MGTLYSKSYVLSNILGLKLVCLGLAHCWGTTVVPSYIARIDIAPRRERPAPHCGESTHYNGQCPA